MARARPGAGGWSVTTASDTPVMPVVAIKARRRLVVRAFELLVAIPLIAYLGWESWRAPSDFLDWRLLVWAGAVALVHLMPMPRRMPFPFSLSFPLQLSVALLYPPPVAAVIVFAASIDQEELRGEHPPSRSSSGTRRSPCSCWRKGRSSTT